MSDIHLTRDLLRAVSRGEVGPRVLTQIGLQHLMALCPHCRREIAAWQKEEKAGAGESALVLQAGAEAGGSVGAFACLPSPLGEGLGAYALTCSCIEEPVPRKWGYGD